MFSVERFDHVGIRVSDIRKAEAFYAELGFRADPQEESPNGRARGLINSHGVRIHLIYNAESAVEAISAILPGAEAPTIMPLMGRPGHVAVQAVCQESVFWETLERLKAAGASAILVMPIEKMML